MKNISKEALLAWIRELKKTIKDVIDQLLGRDGILDQIINNIE